MKSLFAHGALAVMTTASLALAQGSGNGNGEKPVESSSFQEMDMISMAPGEGITFDMGDEFMLNLRNLFQFSYNYAALDDDLKALNGGQNANSFNVDRARTYLSGHVFEPSVQYLLSMEWTEPGAGGSSIDPVRINSTSSLKDGWVQWTFWENEDNAIGVRAGQSKTGFGRQGTSWEGGYELPQRQIATQTFASARTQGAWVGGNHVNDTVHWHAGIMNGDVAASASGIGEAGEETLNPDTELGYILAASWEPNGSMGGAWATEGDLEHTEEALWGVGAGLFFGNNRIGGTDVEATSWNINAVLKTQGIYVEGEYFGREDDPDAASNQDSNGWQVEASYTTEPASTQYGFVVGVSQVQLDDVNTTLTGGPPALLFGDSGDLFSVSVGFDLYYHAHNMKTEFAYVYLQVDPDTAGVSTQDNDLFLVQVQLVF